MKPEVTIVPSMMCADFVHLGRDIQGLEQAGVSALHWDVMDANFVPNLTFGADIVNAARQVSSLRFDVHLMVNHPDLLFRQLRLRQGDSLTFHPEAYEDAVTLLRRIRGAGLRPGLVLNPNTPMEAVVSDALVRDQDMILVMGVYAGFAGQEFIHETVDRLRAVAESPLVLERRIVLAFDGGVTPANAGTLAHAGARCLVSGSYFFDRSRTFTQSLLALRKAARV
jgi:ribulose-phosphate 3-epimerase